MQKYKFVWIILFLLTINIVIADKMHDFDKLPEIEKKDYFQEYINYSFTKLDMNTYIIKYKIDDTFLYSGLKCKDDDCVDSLAKIYADSVKDYNKKTKLTKYTYKDMLDSYLGNNELNNYYSNYLDTNKKFPKEVLSGNIEIYGDVNPFIESGSLIATINDFTVLNSLKIGFETLVITFNNSLEEEYVNISTFFPIGKIKTRYLGVSMFGESFDAYINITPINQSNPGWLEMYDGNGYTIYCDTGNCPTPEKTLISVNL